MTDELRPAHHTYRDVDPGAPDGDGLNLAWTRDERECLAIDLSAMLVEQLRLEPDYLDRYLVRDPYGEDTLGPAVAAAFGCTQRITCGAGVVSLLHGLARLASSVRFVGDVYPDFPYWVAQPRGDSAVWFLERPSLTGDEFADLAELGALCDEAARAGAIVIVDESNANYYPPSWSALGLARDNLVVLRGFSKAYGLGALRLGFAAASPAITERIRTVIPPLLASSLSLGLGIRVLAAGDITAPLRARIAAHKREMIALTGLQPSSEYLPYALASAPLATPSIVGKQHPIWVAKSGSVEHVHRYSVPLAEGRFARLRQLLSC